jgi:glycosyltransferase involved in cell wall biosynthesis
MLKCLNANMKVALVHDFLIQYGGAERVLEVLTEMFPEAPIYTLLYDKEKMRGKFAGKVIVTSFLQKFPKCLRKRYQFLLPLFPTAPEAFDLRDFDLVISSSGAWSKGIVTRLNTIHIAYIHSPMRFVWDYNEKYLKEDRRGKLGFLVRPYLSYLRVWDRMAADRPDFLIANSQYTQARIKKYYRRDSQVIYPPAYVKTSAGKPVNHESHITKHEANSGKYFLIVSRLSAYKKIEQVIEAFNKLQLPLVIVGEGRQDRYLRSIAKENIKFLGWQPNEKLAEIYAGARAFIFSGIDDFGIAPVEAMNYGVPVIALNKGGIKEIVDEKSGVFFEVSTPEIIADGVRRFIENEKGFDKENIKNKAREFSKERFVKELSEYIDKVI